MHVLDSALNIANSTHNHNIYVFGHWLQKINDDNPYAHIRGLVYHREGPPQAPPALIDASTLNPMTWLPTLVRPAQKGVTGIVRTMKEMGGKALGKGGAAAHATETMANTPVSEDQDTTNIPDNENSTETNGNTDEAIGSLGPTLYTTPSIATELTAPAQSVTSSTSSLSNTDFPPQRPASTDMSTRYVTCGGLQVDPVVLNSCSGALPALPAAARVGSRAVNSPLTPQCGMEGEGDSRRSARVRSVSLSSAPNSLEDPNSSSDNPLGLPSRELLPLPPSSPIPATLRLSPPMTAVSRSPQSSTLPRFIGSGGGPIDSRDKSKPQTKAV